MSFDKFRLKFSKKFFQHIVDLQIIVVQIRNIIDRSIIILKNKKIERLQNYEKKLFFCFFRRSSFNNEVFRLIKKKQSNEQ